MNLKVSDVLQNRVQLLLSWLDQVGDQENLTFFAEVVKAALQGKAYPLSVRNPRLQRFVRENVLLIKQVMDEKGVSFNEALNEAYIQGGRHLLKIWSMNGEELARYAVKRGVSIEDVMIEATKRGELALDYAILEQTKEIEQIADEKGISYEEAFLETIDDPGIIDEKIVSDHPHIQFIAIYDCLSSFTLPQSLIRQIQETLIERPELGYLDIGEFIRDALRRRIEQLENHDSERKKS